LSKDLERAGGKGGTFPAGDGGGAENLEPMLLLSAMNLLDGAV